MLLMEITKIIMLLVINDNHNDGDNYCNKNESNDNPHSRSNVKTRNEDVLHKVNDILNINAINYYANSEINSDANSDVNNFLLIIL